MAAAVLAGAPVAAGEGRARGLELDRLDEFGLYGPADGKRSLDYELCIPDAPAYRSEVAAIDPSARFQPGSPGRIGCGPGQILVLGNTHQPGFREVLNRLATLPYVGRIEQAVFE